MTMVQIPIVSTKAAVGEDLLSIDLLALQPDNWTRETRQVGQGALFFFFFSGGGGGGEGGGGGAFRTVRIRPR